MIKINKYLSGSARKVIPYQWEEIPSGNALRFDTNTLPIAPPSLSDFLDAMEDNCPINEYSDPSYKKLKGLVADYEAVDKSMVTITNSGDEAIDVLAKTFLNPGDYFITIPPTYEMFNIQCQINGGKLMEIPLRPKSFDLDDKKLVVAVKQNRVKLVFICNPNNPTATVSSPIIVEKVIKESNCIVVVDEVYREFYGETVVPLLAKYRNLVILRSFSKFAAIAGARVGYLIADKFLTQKFDAIRFPMGVSYFSYKLAEFVLENDREWIKNQVEMIIKGRKRLIEALIRMGFYVYPSFANFLLVKIGDKASDVCKKLKKKGIIIRDRSNKKYLTGCVRITVGSRKENNQLIKALKEIL